MDTSTRKLKDSDHSAEMLADQFPSKIVDTT